VLPDILNRISALPVTVAYSWAPVRPGTAMIAPPDVHLLLESDRVLLVHGPRMATHARTHGASRSPREGPHAKRGVIDCRKRERAPARPAEPTERGSLRPAGLPGRP